MVEAILVFFGVMVTSLLYSIDKRIVGLLIKSEEFKSDTNDKLDKIHTEVEKIRGDIRDIVTKPKFHEFLQEVEDEHI